jgi:hypothetical protein
MMDPKLAIAALQIGNQQAKAEAVTIRAAWSS